MRKAKRKLEGQQTKIAALSMDKVTLLEDAGCRPAAAAAAAGQELAEEQAGGAIISVFDRELGMLKDRQTSYIRSVGSGGSNK